MHLGTLSGPQPLASTDAILYMLCLHFLFSICFVFSLGVFPFLSILYAFLVRFSSLSATPSIQYSAATDLPLTATSIWSFALTLHFCFLKTLLYCFPLLSLILLPFLLNLFFLSACSFPMEFIYMHAKKLPENAS